MSETESRLPLFGARAKPLPTGRTAFPVNASDAYPLGNRPKPVPAPPPPPPARVSDPLANAIASGEDVTLLTPPEAARKLNVGVRTLERWRSTGDGPDFMKLSRKTIRYTEAALRDFANASVKRNTAE